MIFLVAFMYRVATPHVIRRLSQLNVEDHHCEVQHVEQVCLYDDVFRRRGIWRKRGNRNINESNNNLTD